MGLLPSLRQKKRYVLFEIISTDTFGSEDVSKSVLAAVRDFLGVLGVAKSGPIWVKERFKPPFFVIRVNHMFVDELKSAVVLIKKIKNSPVIIRSVAVSGTLAKIGERLKSA